MLYTEQTDQIIDKYLQGNLRKEDMSLKPNANRRSDKVWPTYKDNDSNASRSDNIVYYNPPHPLEKHIIITIITVITAVSIILTALPNIVKGKTLPNKDTNTLLKPKVCKFRLATYNICAGKHIKEVLDNIKKVNPDIICLQEVLTVGKNNGIRYMARVLGADYAYARYTSDTYTGLAILVRGGKIKLLRAFQGPGKEDRNFAIACRVKIADIELTVISMHLKSLERPLIKGVFSSLIDHQKQVKKIIEFTKKEAKEENIILAGDTNTLPFTPAYVMLKDNFTDCCLITKSQHKPSIFIDGRGYRIDHIFLKGDFKVLASDVSTSPGSDHRLIWADIEINIPETSKNNIQDITKTTNKPVTTQPQPH